MMDMSSSTVAAAPSGLPALLPAPRTMLRDVLYLAPAMAIGIASFSVLVSALAVTASLIVFVVGIPLLIATLELARWFALLERRRAAWLLERAIPDPERRPSGGLLTRARTMATDGAAWRDVAWGLVLMPVGIAATTAALTLWGTALGLITTPAWWWAVPADGSPEALNGHGIGPNLLRVAIGVVLIGVAAWTSRGLAAGCARLTRWAIG
jgi:hypothetical protein